MAVLQSLGSLTTALGALTASTEALKLGNATLSDRTNQLQKSMSDMLRIQESLTISNRDAIRENSLEMISLRGGFRGMVQSQTELVRLGFSRNVGSMTELGAAMKISNQNMGEYIDLNKNLLGPGGVQEAAIHRLGRVINDTAIKSGMSNEQLIKGINALKEEMVNLSFLGGAEGAGPAAELMTAFQSAVPPAMNEVAVNLGKSLLSSQVDVNQLARLGIEDLVNRVIKGQGDVSVLSKQIIETAAQNYTQIVGDGANQSVRTMQALDGVLGTMGKQFVAMEKAFVEATGTFDGIASLAENFKEIFGQVFDVIGSKFASALKSAITGISSILAGIGVALLPFAVVIAGIANVLGLIAPVLGAVIAIVGLIKSAGIVWALVTGTLGMVMGPLVLVVAAIGAIASFFGFDLGGMILDPIVGYFNAKESDEEQESLRRLNAQRALEDDLTSKLQNIFTAQYSASEALMNAMIRKFDEGMRITDMPTERPALEAVSPIGR